MKFKRLISLILTSVYLFSVIGTAVAALACECASHEAHKGQLCCHHCIVHPEIPGAKMASDCCSEEHSLEIELYTRASSDNEKQSRLADLALLPAFDIECPCPSHIPFLRIERWERPAPYLDEATLGSVGLRAPPVLV